MDFLPEIIKLLGVFLLGAVVTAKTFAESSCKIGEQYNMSKKIILKFSLTRKSEYINVKAKKMYAVLSTLCNLTAERIKTITAQKQIKKYTAMTVAFLVFSAAVLLSFPPRIMLEQSQPPQVVRPRQVMSLPAVPAAIVQPQVQPEELPIIDLSGNRENIGTLMRQINEPTPWGTEVLYSAGNAASIDGPVLTRLFLYSAVTGEEKELAVSNIRFGEIYEGRFNDRWIVWLDTNQSGTNHIYAMNRNTGEISQISDNSMNRPQIALWENNIVWVGQKKDEQDSMYLYNLEYSEMVKIEDFDNPTYGTSAPALHSNLLVWTYPHPEDAQRRSMIEKLDLTDFINPVDQNAQQQPDLEQSASLQIPNESVETQTIDPDGFAIYPATNGKAIAWLNNLNPAEAELKMTVDAGDTIVSVAQGVGRFFGVGDDFIAYTQQGTIMLYFWETERYATLTAPGEQAKLAELPVSGNIVIWYDATDPNRKQDVVMRSVIPKAEDL